MQTQKIQDLVEKICKNNFTSSDIGMLFIWLRPALAQDSIMLDLSNFIAHAEGRNQGASFLHVKAFVKDFISVSENGGTIRGRQPVFLRSTVIERFIVVIKTLDIKFEEERIIEQKDQIIDYLQELMDEIEFKINEPKVTKCYLKCSNGKMLFCFEADLDGPIIKMSPGASVCSNLFD